MDENEFATKEIEMNKKERRSSILKKERPVCLDESNSTTEANPRISRRVSFASSNFIKYIFEIFTENKLKLLSIHNKETLIDQNRKLRTRNRPFAADSEANTIWDTTYEEAIDYTDSTKSSNERTENTNRDTLNMSILGSCPSLSSSDVYVDKENLLMGKFINSVTACNLTQEDFIVNKENIFFEHGFPPLKENELMSTKSAIDDFTIRQKCSSTRNNENLITDCHSIFELSANVSRIHSHTQYFEKSDNNMDITLHSMPPSQPVGILKNKSDQSHYNPLFQLPTNPTYTNKRPFCEVEDSMNFALVMKQGLQRKRELKQQLINSEETNMEITSNISKYCYQNRDNMDSTQQTILYQPSEGNMEITSTIDNMNCTQKTIVYPPCEGNMDFTSSLPKETFIGNKGDAMEFMKVLPTIQKNSFETINEGVSLFSKAKQSLMASVNTKKGKNKNIESKRQTIIFQNSDGDMDVTSALPTKNFALVFSGNAASEYNNEMSFYSKGKTCNVQHSESNMNLTSVLPLAKNIVNSNLMHKEDNQIRDQDQKNMPVSSDNELNHTQSYLPNTRKKSVIETAYGVTSKQSNTLDKVDRMRIFSNSDGDMELTTILTSGIHCKNISEESCRSREDAVVSSYSSTEKKQFNNAIVNDNSCIGREYEANQEKCIVDKTRVFQPLEGEMDLTTPFSSVDLPEITTGNLIKGSKQKVIADKSQLEITFNNQNREDVDTKQKTHSFQPLVSDIKLTTQNEIYSFITQNEKDSRKFLFLKNGIPPLDSKKIQIFQPQDDDMESSCSSTKKKQINNFENNNSCIERDHRENQDQDIIERARVSEGEINLMKPLACVDPKISNGNLSNRKKQNVISDTSKGETICNKEDSQDITKEETHIFQNSEDDMEFTAEKEDSTSSSSRTKPLAIPNGIPTVDFRRRTKIFQSHEGDMDLTTEIVEQKIIPSEIMEGSIQLNGGEESILELTCTVSNQSISQQGKYQVDNKSSTHIYQISEGNMDFTETLHLVDSLKKNSNDDKMYVKKWMTMDQNKTKIFQCEEGDLELTTVVPPEKQLKTPETQTDNCSHKKEKNACCNESFLQSDKPLTFQQDRRKTKIFQPSEGDMELTYVSSALIPATDNTLENEMEDVYSNNRVPLKESERRSQICHTSEVDMELTLAQNIMKTGNINSSEFTSVFHSTKSHIDIPVENRHHCDSNNYAEPMDIDTVSINETHNESNKIHVLNNNSESEKISCRTDHSLNDTKNSKNLIKCNLVEYGESNIEENISCTPVVKIKSVKETIHLTKHEESNFEIADDNVVDKDAGTQNNPHLKGIQSNNNIFSNSSTANPYQTKYDQMEDSHSGDSSYPTVSNSNEDKKFSLNFVTLRRSKKRDLSPDRLSVNLNQPLDKMDHRSTNNHNEDSIATDVKEQKDTMEMSEKAFSCRKNFEVGGNILYSEPIKMKIDAHISGSEQISTTPPSSFYRHYESYCNEDTQNLINATCSNPESFKLEFSPRLPKKGNADIEEDDIFEQMIKNNGCHEASIANITVNLVRRDSSIQIENETLDNLDVSKKTENPKDCLNTENTIRCSDYNNYTIRSSKLLQNINKYLFATSEEELAKKKEQNERLQKLFKQSHDNNMKIRELLKGFRLPKVKMVLLEDLDKEESNDSSTRSSISDYNMSKDQDEIKKESMECLVPPKTLHERVSEVAERSRNHWEYVKHERDHYYFYALHGTVPFKVHVHPEMGLVYTVETFYNTGSQSKAIAFYMAEILHQKMKNENLLSALGAKYDLLTLLDYVSITVQEINDFRNEFSRIREQYRRYKIELDKDFRITFTVLNMRLIIWWDITIKLSLTNIGVPEDVSAVATLGENVNDADIKSIAHTTLKGINFLSNFIENIEEYIKRISKRLKFR